jgi:hypothetical protein
MGPGVREYVVSPSLKARKNLHNSSDTPSWNDLKRHNLLDSGVAGGITGGMLRGIICA